MLRVKGYRQSWESRYDIVSCCTASHDYSPFSFTRSYQGISKQWHTPICWLSKCTILTETKSHPLRATKYRTLSGHISIFGIIMHCDSNALTRSSFLEQQKQHRTMQIFRSQTYRLHYRHWRDAHRPIRPWREHTRPATWIITVVDRVVAFSYRCWTHKFAPTGFHWEPMTTAGTTSSSADRGSRCLGRWRMMVEAVWQADSGFILGNEGFFWSSLCWEVICCVARDVRERSIPGLVALFWQSSWFFVLCWNHDMICTLIQRFIIAVYGSNIPEFGVLVSSSVLSSSLN